MFRVNGAASVPYPWYRCAGKVKGIAIEVQNGLHDVRVHNLRGIGDGHGQRTHPHILIATDRFDGSLNGGRLDERQITLHVGQNLRIGVSDSHLGHPFRAGAMVGAREHSLPAE